MVSESAVSCGSNLSMHTEAVKTRIFHMTPVSEDAQLHKSIHHVTGVLRGEGGTEEKTRIEKKDRRERQKM